MKMLEKIDRNLIEAIRTVAIMLIVVAGSVYIVGYGANYLIEKNAQKLKACPQELERVKQTCNDRLYTVRAAVCTDPVGAAR